MYNQKVYVLDPAQEPVPIGVVGELCSADGLRGASSGARPDRGRFLDDPFSPLPGEEYQGTWCGSAPTACSS